MKIKSFLLAGVFIVLSLFFAAPMNAKAANFTIDKYEVNMKVTKDNTYQIKEHIEVNFKSKSHGIYRDIPLVNDVKREDGSSNRIVARVENLDCGDEEYESSREGNNLHVRLGDEDVEITGKYEYNISYNYVMGNDVLPNEDEFYFNVIGTGWETTISNVSFPLRCRKLSMKIILVCLMVLTVKRKWMDCIILLMVIPFMVNWIRALPLAPEKA